MKFVHVLLLGLCIYTTKACVFDLPNDAYHACRGIITKIDLPFPKGGVACCERSGSINWASSSDIFGTVRYQCWCPSQNEPSIIAITEVGKRERDEATAPGSQPILDYTCLSKLGEIRLNQQSLLRALQGIPPLSDVPDEDVKRYAEGMARASMNGLPVHGNGYTSWRGFAKDGPAGAVPSKTWYLKKYDPDHPLEEEYKKDVPPKQD